MSLGNLMAVTPPQASTVAGRVDLLFWGLTAITVFFSGLVATLIVFLAWRYRRGRRIDRSNPPRYSGPLEFIWTAIPLVIVLGVFTWAATLYFQIYRAPANAMDIYVVGKQWMWKIQHPEGRWENNELHIPVGKPVKLTMTSEDVIHSFFIPAFRVKQDVLPGRYTQLWFEATKVGTYPLFCAEFCGTDHSTMRGTVTVMEQADYERWLRTGAPQGGLAAQGQRLFMRHGCSGCHGENTSVHAPLLEGIYGKPVAVQIPRGGQPLDQVPATTIVADDRYLHDSIVLPEREVAAGFRPIMPTYQNRLTESEILQIIAYIKSLAEAAPGVPAGNRQRGAQRTGPLGPEEYRARTGFVPSNVETRGTGGRAGAAGAGGAGGQRGTGVTAPRGAGGAGAGASGTAGRAQQPGRAPTTTENREGTRE